MNSHKVVAKHSPVLEAISLVSRIIEGEEFSKVYVHIDDKSLENMLQTSYSRLKKNIMNISLAKILRQMDLKFFFYEFVIKTNERDDMKVFLTELSKITEEDIRTCILESTHAEIIDKNEQPDLWLYYDNTNRLMDEILEILGFLIDEPDIYSVFNKEIMDKITENYITLEEELKERHPLSYAQSLFGKSFYTIADWSVYEFHYLYYMPSFILRIMDKNTNMVLVSMNRRREKADEMEANVLQWMKLLSDPKRIKILKLIYSNPLMGKEIAKECNLTTATISHHIDLLRKEALIHEERDKNTKYFSTNQTKFHYVMLQINRYITSKDL